LLCSNQLVVFHMLSHARQEVWLHPVFRNHSIFKHSSAGVRIRCEIPKILALVISLQGFIPSWCLGFPAEPLSHPALGDVSPPAVGGRFVCGCCNSPFLGVLLPCGTIERCHLLGIMVRIYGGVSIGGSCFVGESPEHQLQGASLCSAK
jgi:hypothetical protein